MYHAHSSSNKDLMQLCSASHYVTMHKALSMLGLLGAVISIHHCTPDKRVVCLFPCRISVFYCTKSIYPQSRFVRLVLFHSVLKLASQLFIGITCEPCTKTRVMGLDGIGWDCCYRFDSVKRLRFDLIITHCRNSFRSVSSTHTQTMGLFFSQ